MKPKSLMLIGGSERTNNDHASLLRSEGKIETHWACPKNARIGDKAYIYISAPVSSVIASAQVLGLPRPGKPEGWAWRYVAKIGPIQLLPDPIGLEELKRLCPRWKWLRYPRAYAYIPEQEGRVIVSRAHLDPSMVPKARLSRTGAGFGTPETNRKVESAAIKAVSRYYRKHGAKVVSREMDNLGYDLDVINGRRVHHVEVKGVANTQPSFVITANELRCADTDSAFVLAVVTNALHAKQRRIVFHAARRFRQRYDCQPLSFKATLAKGAKRLKVMVRG